MVSAASEVYPPRQVWSAAGNVEAAAHPDMRDWRRQGSSDRIQVRAARCSESMVFNRGHSIDNFTMAALEASEKGGSAR